MLKLEVGKHSLTREGSFSHGQRGKVKEVVEQEKLGTLQGKGGGLSGINKDELDMLGGLKG